MLELLLEEGDDELDKLEELLGPEEELADWFRGHLTPAA